MPIVINNQPSAAAVGSAAYAAGAENLRRYEQAQALQQQELAQRAALTREGYANQRTMQGQQLDYSSRAAALGVLANQSSQARQFDQQRYIQDQSLGSAAQLQDQRLQYGMQELQAQLDSRAALQQQSLGAQFARQYLSGAQASAQSQQNFLQNAALNQQQFRQNIDFAQYKLDATAQAELNKIRQNRAQLEQMKLSGQVNDQQYRYADAQIKARELGLSKALPPQENQDLVSELKQSIVQDPNTGAWFKKNRYGEFEILDLQQKQNEQMNKFQFEQAKYDMQTPERVADFAIKFYSESLKTDNPISLPEARKRAEMALGLRPMEQFDGGLLRQERQALGMTQPGGNPGMGQRLIQVRSDAEVMSLPSGTVYMDPQGNRRVRR